MLRKVPSWIWVFLTYLVVFFALAARLLPEFGRAVPMRPNLDDSYVITWVLAWVSHALFTQPLAVFDANIAYPALGQLTSTHHLFASQLLFAPLYALTGNPILATNLLALLTYPLAALAMERLLRELGIAPVVAWVAGLVFALGVLRVPFNLNLIQYPNLYLPWVALCLTRLRERPDGARAALLLLAFGLGLFACFYEAVLLGVASAIWALFELARRRPGRMRFLARGLGSSLLAAGLLLLVARPYFVRVGVEIRPQEFILPLNGMRAWIQAAMLALGLFPQSVGMVPRPLSEVAVLLIAALIALLAWMFRLPTGRRVVPVALALWLTGAVFSWGYPSWLAPLIAASPLSMVRYVYRYVVVGDFGLVLLLAVALSALWSWLGTRAGVVASAAIAIVVLIDRGVPFGATSLHVVPALTSSAPVYDAVAEIVHDQGGGALLELPSFGSLPGVENPGSSPLEPDAMLASTRHWWPTPAAHTSYHAPHRWLYMNTVAALPAPWALDDLIDLTHVRWLLLRPPQFWKPPEQRATMLQLLLSSPAVGERWEHPDGWTLLRLDRAPAHPTWFETVRQGGLPNATVLGTPLESIPEDAAVAEVRVDRDRLEPVVADSRLTLALLVRNTGGAIWPTSPPPSRPLTLDGRLGGPLPIEKSVFVMARWWRVGSGAPELVATHRQRLRRDVAPGEEIRQLIGVPLPDRAGTYELELAVEQADGARFTGKENAPYRMRVQVSDGTATLEPPPATGP